MPTENDIPFLSSDGTEDETFEGAEVERGANHPDRNPSLDLSEEERLYRVLMLSSKWSDTPCIPGQATTFPETTRTVGCEVKVLNLETEQDAKLLADILFSTEIGGGYVLVRPEKTDFNPKTGKYTSLVVYKKRKFKVPDTEAPVQPAAPDGKKESTTEESKES